VIPGDNVLYTKHQGSCSRFRHSHVVWLHTVCPVSEVAVSHTMLTCAGALPPCTLSYATALPEGTFFSGPLATGVVAPCPVNSYYAGGPVVSGWWA
jgi:hypothetical protein